MFDSFMIGLFIFNIGMLIWIIYETYEVYKNFILAKQLDIKVDINKSIQNLTLFNLQMWVMLIVFLFVICALTGFAVFT